MQILNDSHNPYCMPNAQKENQKGLRKMHFFGIIKGFLEVQYGNFQSHFWHLDSTGTEC